VPARKAPTNPPCSRPCLRPDRARGACGDGLREAGAAWDLESGRPPVVIGSRTATGQRTLGQLSAGAAPKASGSASGRNCPNRVPPDQRYRRSDRRLPRVPPGAIPIPSRTTEDRRRTAGNTSPCAFEARRGFGRVDAHAVRARQCARHTNAHMRARTASTTSAGLARVAPVRSRYDARTPVLRHRADGLRAVRRELRDRRVPVVPLTLGARTRAEPRSDSDGRVVTTDSPCRTGRYAVLGRTRKRCRR